MADIRKLESTIQESFDWEVIQPEVNAEAEFFETLNDFGNPMELLREAISNAIDAEATWIKIAFDVEQVKGKRRLVIVLSDNGQGMTHDVLSQDFWGLGYSRSRGREGKIGEKGHGTKIYFRSEGISVRTQSSGGAYESVCKDPLEALSSNTLHKPKLRAIDNFLDDGETGTEITILGYNDNERSKFIQGIVRDYILWFTKVGSIERVFGLDKYEDFTVKLKCLGESDFEDISFGHVFPKESPNIHDLFDKLETAAADWYVKRHVFEDRSLTKHPEVKYQAVISVEGNEVKKQYNPMVKERRRKETGRYRVGDRYGIWLCKDFIPIVRVNDWISGFGSGSNAYVLLHGFVNCQDLKLTANRGTIANTDPEILEELKSEVQDLISQVDTDLYNEGLYTLRSWQEEQRTKDQEKAEFNGRVKNLKGRKVAELDGRLLIEPQNESELFGLFITVYTLRPKIFEFEPLDYNTNRGIDIIARNKSDNKITEGEHWYIELKHTLQKNFNHGFEYIRWIICWDFAKDVVQGTEFQGVEEDDIRKLETEVDDNDQNIYFLNNRRKPRKIPVIRLKEYLRQELSIEFVEDTKP